MSRNKSHTFKLRSRGFLVVLSYNRMSAHEQIYTHAWMHTLGCASCVDWIVARMWGEVSHMYILVSLQVVYASWCELGENARWSGA
jgi:hypothetical protein